MPPTPETILPHARSLNNITLSHLLRPTSSSSSTATTATATTLFPTNNSSETNAMIHFLTTSLAGVPSKTANSIVTSLGLQDTLPNNLTPSQVFFYIFIC